MEEYSKDIVELFKDPVRWCEAFLRNPNNKEEPFKLRPYQQEIISQTQNYRNIILRYGRRMGKCTRNSLILNELGELFKVESLLNKTISSVSISDDYEYVPSVARCSSDGVKPVYLLTTKSGRKIEGTENQPFLTVGGWKWLSELKPGNTIAVPSKIEIESNRTIEEHKLKLIAYLLSDGCIIRSIAFGNANNKIQKEFEEVIEKFDCALSIKERQNNYKQYTVSGRVIDRKRNKNFCLEYIRDIDLFGCDSYTKKIPNEIMTLSKKQQALFLSRLYACDGWASVSKSNRRSGNCEIGYCSVSSDLIHGVGHLLTRFGIRHFITEKKIKFNKKPFLAYQLCIRTKSDINTFLNEIGIFSKEEQCINVQENIKKRIEKETYFDSLPTNDIIGQFKIKHPRKYNIRKQHNRTLISKFKEYAKIANDTSLMLLCDAPFYFDEIKSIQYIGDHEVFDLEVPEYHNFIANDIILHNSITMCADTLWWCAAYPLVRIINGETTKQLPFRVVIATPYDTQINELWNTYMMLIADSPLLQELISNVRSSDPQQILFENGSKIEGHTIGISSSNKGTSMRSISADMLFLDEMDFIPRDIIERAIMPIWTTHTNCRMRICSTPSGQRSLFWEWCLDKCNKVNTVTGLKSIDSIEPGTMIYGQDGNLEKVVACYKRNYQGIMYSVRTPAGLIKGTPNHSFKLFNKDFTRLDEITKKDYILVPKQYYKFKPIKIDVQNIKQEHELKREQILSRCLEVGPNQSAKEFNMQRSQVGKYKQLKKIYPDTWMFDDRKRQHIKKAQTFLDNIATKNLFKLFRLLGYYIAEGCILKDFSCSKGYYSGLQLSFNLNETSYIDDVCSLTTELFNPESIKLVNDREDNSCSILIYGSWLSYLFITLVGEYSDKKEIHSSLLYFEQYTKHLLDTYINSDGWKISEGQYSYTTNSRRLSEQLYSITINNGIPASYYDLGYKFQIRQLKGQSFYRKDFNNNIYLRVKTIKEENFTGPVYNLETERTHTYNVFGMCSHNCTRAEELGWLHRHYPSWHPDNTNWMSIEQAKLKGVPVTESTEFQVRAITESSAYDREYGAEFGEEIGGVFKQSLINKSIRKYGRDINLEDVDLFDPKFDQHTNNLYIMGVDWNTYLNGGQIVVLEFCRAPTIVNFYDDESRKDITIDFTGKYRLFYRRGIKSKEATQRKTREEIIRLVNTFKIDFIYVDYGAGDTNIEELTLYGKDHPELHLNTKLRVIDSGAAIEHYDPVIQKIVKKRNKSLMVSLSVLNLEEGFYILPREEDDKMRLVGQMRDYAIKNVTNRGDYTYVGEDHVLDAFNLASYGFHKEYGQLLSNRAVYNILFLNDPRLQDYPKRADEAKSPIAAQSKNIRDPELPINPKNSLSPRLIKYPFRRPNISNSNRNSYVRQNIY